MNKKSILTSLFTIQNIHVDASKIVAEVAINAESEIYKAHFPSDPITPGVCQVHLIKDILDAVYSDLNFSLSSAKNIKFTEVLRPNENEQIIVNLVVLKNPETINVNSYICNKEKTFLKAKLEYKISE